MSMISLFSISQNDVPQILFYGMLRSINIFKKDYKIEDKSSWQNKFVNIVGLF